MIKAVNHENLVQAIKLVNEVFSEFVAVDYSEEGRETFATYLKDKHHEISSKLSTGEKKMWAYYQNDEIVGVIAIKNNSHLTLMFVAKEYHKKGIARKMFNFVLEGVRKARDITQITVNASPYAVQAYEHLGFSKTREQQELNGIIFIPMACPVQEKIQEN